MVVYYMHDENFYYSLYTANTTTDPYMFRLW